jgi:ribosomal protein L34E
MMNYLIEGEKIMITFEQIRKANENIKTISVKGKKYAEVNQRIKAFRMCYPNGSISTEILSLVDGIVTMKAIVCNEEGQILGTGTAQENEKTSLINKTSYIENCETSAVGRALGMCGFGIETSVSSAEEVQNAIRNQETQKIICEECGVLVENTNKRNGEVWFASEMKAYSERRYGKCLCADCMKKAENDMKKASEKQ